MDYVQIEVQEQPVRLMIEDFGVGASLWVPCLDYIETRREVVRALEGVGFKVKTRNMVENGIYGLRVWRIA